VPLPLEQAEAPNAQIGPQTIECLLSCARETPRGGCFVEVGVYQGGSAMHLHALALEQGRTLFLYDTFEGMPYHEAGLDSHPLGDFANTSIDRVRKLCPSALITKGVFPGSAIGMPPIAFAHVDVDNYRCVLESGQYLFEHVMPGGVIWFDDSPCLAGAAKATKELFGDVLELSATGQHYIRL